MILKRLIRCIDRKKEMREIRNIILLTRKLNPAKNPMQEECDQVFLRRLETNRAALRLSFWENHFEWKAVLSDYPEISGRILDFGCGSGHSDIFLARSGMTVHGIDLSPVGIALANNIREREEDSVKSRLSFSVSDVIADVPENGLYDAAWSSHVFEHVSDPKPILEGLRRWLKPKSPLLISVPLGNAYDDPGHVNHFYSKDELKEFLGTGVKVEKMDICDEYKVIRAVCYIE